MRRSHRATTTDTTRLAPVLADEPVEVHNPRRKLRVLTLLFATAIILSAFASAYIATVIAYRQSTHHTDQRIAALEHDLAQRRADRAERDQQTQALLEQYRHTICVLAAQHAAQHAGPDIDRLRADFHCGELAASPAPTPTPSTPPPRRGGPTAAGRAQGTTRRNPEHDQPQSGEASPRPRPSPQPSPTPSAQPLTVCLPLLGCLD